MKHTMKKPSYYLLSQAMDGDEKAIEKILASFFNIFRSKTNHYPYIQDQKRTLPFEFTGL